MTDEQNKSANKAYQTVKPHNRVHPDGQSKWASQTTWGPSRRKKKRPVGQVRMTPEDWHRQYSELVGDRDTQARHVASLDEELYEERQKLNRLEAAIKDWMRSTPQHDVQP